MFLSLLFLGKIDAYTQFYVEIRTNMLEIVKYLIKRHSKRTNS